MSELRVVTRILAGAATVLAVVLTGLVAASSPAQAAGRTFVHAASGLCVRHVADGLQGYPDLRNCSTRPVSYRNWSFVAAGNYNGHPLVLFKNVQTSRCIRHIGGGPLMNTCRSAALEQKWELFYVGSGTARRMVVKSLGAWLQEGRHVCLRYLNPAGAAGNLMVSPCNLNDTKQRFRP